MKRIDDNTIAITNEEAEELREMLRDFLYREWDRYTDNVISSRPLEEGMEYMNPSAYKIADELSTI